MPRVLPPYGDINKKSMAWGVVIVACICNFLDLFQSSMVMFGLTNIQKSLDFTSSDLNWVLVAYTLTFATFLPIGGQLADRMGLRSTFLIGTFMLFWTNILISWTPNKDGMLAGRALAGVGAAFTVSLSCDLIISLVTIIYSARLVSPLSAIHFHLAKIEMPDWQSMSHVAQSALC